MSGKVESSYVRSMDATPSEEPILDVEKAQFVGKTLPPRVAVTQEFMVESILAEMRGEGSNHPASEYFPDVLFESIQDMVGMLASRYVALSGTDKDDLCQLCMTRMWDKLSKFDSKKSAFSTWSWHVCMRVIWKECRKMERTRKVIVGSEKAVELNATESPHESHLMRSEIARAVKGLMERYPNKERIIVELFGDPREIGYIPYAKICFAKSARAAGVSPSDVSTFYKRKAQPFLQRKLRETRGN